MIDTKETEFKEVFSLLYLPGVMYSFHLNINNMLTNNRTSAKRF